MGFCLSLLKLPKYGNSYLKILLTFDFSPLKPIRTFYKLDQNRIKTCTQEQANKCVGKSKFLRNFVAWKGNNSMYTTSSPINCFCTIRQFQSLAYTKYEEELYIVHLSIGTCIRLFILLTSVKYFLRKLPKSIFFSSWLIVVYCMVIYFHDSSQRT